MNISATKFISGCDKGGDKGDRRGVLERSHKRFVNVEPRSVIGLIRIYGREELRHLNVLRSSVIMFPSYLIWLSSKLNRFK